MLTGSVADAVAWRSRRPASAPHQSAWQRVEVVQVLPHLLQRKSQREKPLRDIDGHAADQALASHRGDLGGIGLQRRIDGPNVHRAAAVCARSAAAARI